MGDLIIFAPRAVCAEKAKEYGFDFGNDMWNEKYTGLAKYSFLLHRYVNFLFTDINYTYTPKDFAKHKDPEYIVYSPDKHKVDWIKHPQYFNV